MLPMVNTAAGGENTMHPNHAFYGIYKEITTDMEHVKTITNFINEGKSKDMVAELNEMTLGQLERISDYANMIKGRMEKGQQPESWMYSQLTIALENLNSVHDAMDGVDGVEEVNTPYKY